VPRLGQRQRMQAVEPIGPLRDCLAAFILDPDTLGRIDAAAAGFQEGRDFNARGMRIDAKGYVLQTGRLMLELEKRSLGRELYVEPLDALPGVETAMRLEHLVEKRVAGGSRRSWHRPQRSR